MRAILFWPFAVFAMVVQSVILALGQIWAHKMRAVLTTLGILIGVASVTAVIAGLSGVRATIAGDFETLGTKRMWAYARHPRRGPKRNWPWSKITLRASACGFARTLPVDSGLQQEQLQGVVGAFAI